jgi:Domain of unknown function (DUF4129)
MRGFLLTFLLILSFRLAAQDTAEAIDSVNYTGTYNNSEMVAQPDSSIIQSRSFDKKVLEELRSDDDFDYKQPPTVAESVWDRFILWLDQIFGWILRSAVGTDWGRVFMYALGLVVLIVIVMMVLKVDALRVFYSGADKGSLNYQAFQENIHEMNFEKLIQDALDKKEYRNGVRLTFLYALKLLSDKQHVDWRPGKTNHDYMEELKKADLKIGFNELSFYFDYAWYGEFNVNEAMYQRVHSIFDTWRKKIG